MPTDQLLFPDGGLEFGVVRLYNVGLMDLTDRTYNAYEARAKLTWQATPKIKVNFKIGQKVRIVEGPFEDFMGTVDDIDMDRARAKVLVNFFGRETPIELDFLQVERT